MKSLKSTLIILFLYLQPVLFGQDGFYVNGINAALFVPAGHTLYCKGDFRVMQCDPILQVRFAGTLLLTGSLQSDGILRFNPTQASQSKLCKLTFLPGPQCNLSGSVAPTFWEVEVDKGGGSSIVLNNSIICRDTLFFKSGFVYINGRHCILQDPVGATDIISHPWIKSERNGSQFLASNGQDTGKVIYSSIYTSSLNFNSANIGLRITGLVNTGSPVQVIRGFKNQINAAKGSIGKYFDVFSPGHKLTNNSISLDFHLNDAATSPVNFINTSALSPYVAPLVDNNWTPLNYSLTTAPVTPNNINGNMLIQLYQLRNVLNLADSNAFRITLADPDCNSVPISQLNQDTAFICTGDSILLDAGNISGLANPMLRYQWDTSPVKNTRTLQIKPTTSFQKIKLLIMNARGCISRDSIAIAPSAPLPQITYFNHLNACLGDSITIKDTVTIASGSFSNTFVFSDQSILQTNKSLFRTFINNTGIYSVTLTSTSNHGCTSRSVRNNLQVLALPVSAFSTSLNCVNRQMDFSNLSTSNSTLFPIVLHRWQFGDALSGTSTLTSPGYSYSASGTFTVKLYSETSFGCKDSTQQLINVPPQNTAYFQVSNICNSDSILLQDMSTCNTGNCTSRWDFGDQSFSTQIQQFKKYTNPGLYQIKLKTEGPVGCADSLQLPIFIYPTPSSAFSISSTNYCENENIYFNNNSSISGGTITSVTWKINNQTQNTTWNTSTSALTAGLHSVKLTTISNSGCQSISQNTVIVHPLPTSQLFATPVCSGDTSFYTSLFQSPNFTYELNLGTGLGSYTYSSATMPVLYNAAGLYTSTLIIYSSFGCSDTSTFTHTVNPLPSSPFQNTISTCGNSYRLDALNPGSTFNWWPGNQITSTINCQQAGEYRVSITNTLGCTTTAKVVLKLNSPVKPNLGRDTVHCGEYALNAGYNGSTFQWNTGSSNQSILVNTTGTYIVMVTDQNLCNGSDTIVVAIKNLPKVSADPDITTCRILKKISLSSSGDASNYFWNTAETGTTINVSASGIYWVEGIGQNNCHYRDTILVNILKTPTVDLGGNKTACGNFVLNAKNKTNYILWHDGSSVSEYTVHSTKKVWVRVTDPQNSCWASDTAIIEIEKVPYFNLGGDTALCNNSTHILSTGTAVGNILWTNGATSNTIITGSSGQYGATIKVSNNCLYSDYILITRLNSPLAEIGPPLRYLCNNNEINLISHENCDRYWFKNSSAIGTGSSITVSEPGLYKLLLSNGSCRDQDSVIVTRTTNTVEAHFLASTVDTINKAVQFINLSRPKPTTCHWDFGDNQTSTEENPTHTWFLPDDVPIKLSVTNGFCADEFTSNLKILFRDYFNRSEKEKDVSQVLFFPNPTKKELNVHCEFTRQARLLIEIFNSAGLKIWEKDYGILNFYRGEINLLNMPCGLYHVRYQTESPAGIITDTKKLVISD